MKLENIKPIWISLILTFTIFDTASNGKQLMNLTAKIEHGYWKYFMFKMHVFCCSTILFICIIWTVLFFTSPVLNRNVCLIARCTRLILLFHANLSVSELFIRVGCLCIITLSINTPILLIIWGINLFLSASKSESPCESRTPWHEIRRIFLDFQYALKQKNEPHISSYKLRTPTCTFTPAVWSHTRSYTTW